MLPPAPCQAIGAVLQGTLGWGIGGCCSVSHLWHEPLSLWLCCLSLASPNPRACQESSFCITRGRGLVVLGVLGLRWRVPCGLAGGGAAGAGGARAQKALKAMLGMGLCPGAVGGLPAQRRLLGGAAWAANSVNSLAGGTADQSLLKPTQGPCSTAPF